MFNSVLSSIGLSKLIINSVQYPNLICASSIGKSSVDTEVDEAFDTFSSV